MMFLQIYEIYIILLIPEKIKTRLKTPYQEIAKKYGTTSDYVGMVARGRYKAQRGKALLIKQELEQLVKQ